MIAMLVLLILLIVVVCYMVGIYNGLVRVRAAVKLAWSNIDVLLVQRHDELPKLVATCSQYLQYEQKTLERVMQAPEVTERLMRQVGLERARECDHGPSLGM